MGFTRDFDIFLYLRENEEEVYTILFPSPLYIFLIHLPFFCKKKTEKKILFFFGENVSQTIGQIFFGILLRVATFHLISPGYPYFTFSPD